MFQVSETTRALEDAQEILLKGREGWISTPGSEVGSKSLDPPKRKAIRRPPHSSGGQGWAQFFLFVPQTGLFALHHLNESGPG